MTRPPSSAAGPVLLLVAALGSVLGCAGASGSSSSGTGGSVGACTTTTCLPAAGPPSTWMIEIDPPSSSSSSAPGITQMLAPPLTNGSLQLMADSQMPVTATFTAPPDVAAPSTGTVILTVPSLIPGRPALTFQTSAVASPSNVVSAALLVPASMVTAGGKATLSLVPLPPADQQSPPYIFTDVTLGSTLQTSIATDTFAISGVLETPGGGVPNPTFVARAFQGNAQVSNAPLTSGTDGSFRLLLPASVAQGGEMLTIQLTSQSPNDPWFVFAPISLPSSPPLGFSLGTVLLFAYQPVNQYNVLVEGKADQMRVNGALVRALITLGTSSSSTIPAYKGTTTFAQNGMTDANGLAAMSLLPNEATYEFSVVPPSGSPYATACFSQVGIAGGAASPTAPGAPTLGPFQLPARAVMSGKVTDASGRPVAKVVVTATPGSATLAGCTSTPAAQASTTTDSQGNYSLPLDPGTDYKLDLDPPAGTLVPRLTDPVITVLDSGAFTHDVRLPAAGLVTGTVSDSNQDPVPSATVQLFDPQSTPPVLRGQGKTDANGSFQIVISTQ